MLLHLNEVAMIYAKLIQEFYGSCDRATLRRNLDSALQSDIDSGIMLRVEKVSRSAR